MSVNIEEILKHLGWTDGFQIPIANAENKALEEELAKLSLRKQKCKTSLDIVNNRFQALNEHFKYVSQENEQTQKLITAHKQHYDALENAYHTTKAENQNTIRAIKTNTNQLKESEEMQNQRKNDLIKQVAKADKLKAEMDWDAEALKAWEEALKKRDEDIELLRKFFKDDDRKFNQLEAKRQHLQAELATMRGKVAKLAVNSDNCEHMIERSGKVIKQLTVERDALINQWKDTVKMLQQRDNDIIRTQEEMYHVQEMIQKQEEKLEQENKFLENEKRNNRNLELEIQEANNVNSKLRREMADLYQMLLLMNTDVSILLKSKNYKYEDDLIEKRFRTPLFSSDNGLQKIALGLIKFTLYRDVLYKSSSNFQYHTLKRQVSAAAHHLKNERLKAKRMDEVFAEKEVLCAKYAEEVAILEDKLHETKNCAMTSEDRIKRIEKIIEHEEKLYNISLADTEKTNGVLFRSEQQLKEQKALGKNLEIEINTGACTTAQLRKHIQSERKELDRIKEVVYEMEFRIDECEKKLYELSDVKFVEISEEKQQKIQELEKTLSDHKELQHSLQNQVDRLREEMRRLTTVIAADKEVLEALENKCENFLLVYEISQKQIAAAKKSIQEKQVEENMMRLRINQIEKDKKKEEKQIFNLEKFRLNLDQAMKERQLEINTQKMILQTKKRNLEEDKGRLKADISLRKLKIDQYQKKYHLALTGLGKDEEGQTMSVTHFKIKNAQEKFFLQQEGDELDKKIKTAEKEIVALENTLKIINITNNSFKNSLSPVKDTDPEIKDMKELQDQLKAANNELKLHKTELAAKQKEFSELEQQFETLEGEVQQHEQIVQNLEDEIFNVKKQELDKTEKLKRVECELKKLVKQLDKKDKQDLYKYNRDFEIRHLQETNKRVLDQFREFTITYPEMSPMITKYLTENNLELPENKKTPSSYSTLSTPSLCNSTEIQNTQRSTASRDSSSSNVSLNKIELALKI
ncbi:coiled-coil domain-containing protein 39 [Diorhabda sublineata]|uniref:coiled-coil domain-containing protein 39 n=1 Tax=Diorhabda sublineata TaxID=1163346 RepID=UPI0024E07C3D|nr:coiled-coil domain-containing protein 39 [Diorhabda sublineata]